MTTEVILNSSSPYLSKPLPLAWATIDSELCMDQAGAAARIIRTKSATNLRITRMGSLPQSLRISLLLLARWGYRNTVSFDRLLTGETLPQKSQHSANGARYKSQGKREARRPW